MKAFLKLLFALMMLVLLASCAYSRGAAYPKYKKNKKSCDCPHFSYIPYAVASENKV